MLEGVLKAWKIAQKMKREGSFNPWYVGGGVKSFNAALTSNNGLQVSILGMLEGVLKDIFKVHICGDMSSFNPWYVGGGVKRSPTAWHFG